MVGCIHARINSVGNLHFNVATPSYDKSVYEALEPWIYEFTGS